MTITKTKRINFSKFNAGHLYELAHTHFESDCFTCLQLKKRLEQYIGVGEAKRIRAQVKKRPYCKPL